MYGQRTVGLYSPADTKMAKWHGGMAARDTASEMEKWHSRLDDEDKERRNLAEQGRMFSMGQAGVANNMAAAEQQRRQYDSETARMGQEQKFGLLGSLLGAPRRIV